MRAQTILSKPFASLAYGNFTDLLHVLNALFISKLNHEKIPWLPIQKFLSLVLPRNVIWLQNFIIHFMCYHLSSGCLREVKKKEKISNVQFYKWSQSLTRGDRLQKVPNIVISLEIFEYFGKLVTEERWLLARSGCNWKFNCIIFGTGKQNVTNTSHYKCVVSVNPVFITHHSQYTCILSPNFQEPFLCHCSMNQK